MISEGDVVFLDYGEVPQVVRLVAAHVQDDLYVIVTPDFDVYEEQLSALNPDVVSYHYGGPGLAPAGVDPARVYGFRALSAPHAPWQDVCQWSSSRIGATSSWGSPGSSRRGGSCTQVAPAVWIFMESRGNVRRGDVVFGEGQALPAGAIHQGDRAIIVGANGDAICLKRLDRIRSMMGGGVKDEPGGARWGSPRSWPLRGAT